MPEIINGYEIREKFVLHSNCFYSNNVVKNGKRYFMKRFLSPKYPVLDSTTPKDYETRKARCEHFIAHHLAMDQALKRWCSYGGSVVLLRDFFMDKSEYYAVTDYINQSYSVYSVSQMPLIKRLVIMRSACDGVRMFHRAGIVHGDIKSDNLLLYDNGVDDYGVRIIDYDSSYFEGKPFQNDTVATEEYTSPEFLVYCTDISKPQLLTTKADIFALGIVFHEYATGAMPDCNSYPSCSISLLNHQELGVNNDVQPALRTLICRMLSLDYTERPTIDEVHSCLMDMIASQNVKRIRTVP